MSNAECDAKLLKNESDPRFYTCGFRQSQLNGTIYSPQCSAAGWEVVQNDYVFNIVPLNLTDTVESACINHYDCDAAHPFVNAFQCCALLEFSNNSYTIEYPACIPRFQDQVNDTTSDVTVGIKCFSSQASLVTFAQAAMVATLSLFML